MEQQLRDVNVLWTPDLTVGSASLDEHNREMFDQLGTVEDHCQGFARSFGNLANRSNRSTGLVANC